MSWILVFWILSFKPPFWLARILECVTISFSGDLPDPEIVPAYPALQADSLLLSHQRSPINICTQIYACINIYMCFLFYCDFYKILDIFSCASVSPCCLPILYIIACICYFQSLTWKELESPGFSEDAPGNNLEKRVTPLCDSCKQALREGNWRQECQV